MFKNLKQNETVLKNPKQNKKKTKTKQKTPGGSAKGPAIVNKASDREEKKSK